MFLNEGLWDCFLIFCVIGKNNLVFCENKDDNDLDGFFEKLAGWKSAVSSRDEIMINSSYVNMLPTKICAFYRNKKKLSLFVKKKKAEVITCVPSENR